MIMTGIIRAWMREEAGNEGASGDGLILFCSSWVSGVMLAFAACEQRGPKRPQQPLLVLRAGGPRGGGKRLSSSMPLAQGPSRMGSLPQTSHCFLSFP